MFRRVWSVAAVVGAVSTTACSDQSLVRLLEPPTVAITSHVPDQEVVEGTHELVAQVADRDADPTELAVQWLVDGAPVCLEAQPDAAGLSRCPAELGPGTTPVSVTVIDPDEQAAATGLDLVVLVNEAPEAAITDPGPDAILYAETGSRSRPRWPTTTTLPGISCSSGPRRTPPTI